MWTHALGHDAGRKAQRALDPTDRPRDGLFVLSYEDMADDG